MWKEKLFPLFPILTEGFEKKKTIIIVYEGLIKGN